MKSIIKTAILYMNRQKDTRCIQIGKEEVKEFLFVFVITVYSP